MLDYKEIPGWFNEKSADTLRKLIEENEVKSVIEIGSFVGKSAVFFAGLVDTVYCVDPFLPWAEGMEDDLAKSVTDGKPFFSQFVQNTKDYRNIVPIRATSEDAALLFPDFNADLVYIDGNHDLASVVKDIETWYPRARKVICGDDYNPPWVDVKTAVDILLPDAARPGPGEVLWWFAKN